MAAQLSAEASPLLPTFVYDYPATSPAVALFRARAEALAESWRLRYLVARSGPVPGEWRERAACARVPAARWWEMSKGNAACSVCAGCPVRMPCIQQTRSDDDRTQVWLISGVSGGFTGPTRVALQRRLRAAAGRVSLEADDLERVGS